MSGVIHVYNENCVLSGKIVRGELCSRYGDLDDFADCHSEELTEENAKRQEAIGSQYHLRIARSIRDAM